MMGHVEYDRRGVIVGQQLSDIVTARHLWSFSRPLIYQTTDTELDMANAFRDRPPRIPGAASCKGSGALA